MLLCHLFDRPVIIPLDLSVLKESEQTAKTPISCKIGVADVLDFVGRGERTRQPLADLNAP